MNRERWREGFCNSRKTMRLSHSLGLISKMATGLKNNLEVALGFLSLAELLKLNSGAQHQFGQTDLRAETVWPESVIPAAEGMGDLKAAEWIIWTQISMLTKDRSAAADHHFLTKKNISLKQVLWRGRTISVKPTFLSRTCFFAFCLIQICWVQP